MSTVQEKVDALFKNKTREEIKQITEFVKQSASIKAFSEIAHFVRQAEIECDTDGLIANVAATVIEQMQQGFARLLEGRERKEIDGVEVSKMTCNVLRKFALHIEDECLRMMKTHGGIQ